MFVTIVLDGVGIGEQPDAARYGDEGSNTLGNVCAAARPDLPNLTQLGLGCIAPLEGVPPVERPRAHFGRMQEASAGKDSTTGHWELAGLRLDRPFPTYPDGFPADFVASFLSATGVPGILGNKAASGTAIIDELGAEHQRTGWPIVYTSADSVCQIAAHHETLRIPDLYALCETVREQVCIGRHAVGRVIARPFTGKPGAYTRISEKRRDFSVRLPSETLQEALMREGIPTVAVGKIGDLFGNVGFSKVVKTTSNADGIERLLQLLPNGEGFLWANLVDFDQEFGHRNDVQGFAQALEAFDRSVPKLIDALPRDSRLVITADHGNDPTTPSTDHSREYVPLLYYDGRDGTDLGTRPSFNDHAATVAAYFGVPFTTRGTPFTFANA